jgi:hypothetical protein
MGRLARFDMRVLVVTTVAVAIALGNASAAPAAAGQKKLYSESMVSVSPPPENNKDALFGGQGVQLAITITNQPTSLQPIGSVNVAIPATYIPVALISVTTSPVAHDWSNSTLDVPGALLKLRNVGPNTSNALKPGESVTAVVLVTTECAPNSTRTWITRVKQSNDFSGTGNDFTLVGSYPTSTVHVGCPDHLAFDQQPTNTIAGQPIDGALLPAGVSVDIFDSANQLVTIATNPIGMAIGHNPGSGTLFGTTPVNASGGIATFSDLAIDLKGAGYTLAASSSGLTSATSVPFDVTGIATKCGSDPSCHGATGTKATPSDPAVGTADVPVSGCSDQVCFLSLDESTGNFCNGPCIANTIVFVPPSNVDGVGTVTIEIYKGLLPGNLNSVGVFKLNSDGTTTQLFDCSFNIPVPCVSGRSHVNGGNGLFTISVGPNDPVFGTH